MTVSGPSIGKFYEIRNQRALWRDYDSRKAFHAPDVYPELGKWILIASAIRREEPRETYWLFRVIVGEDIGWMRSERDDWEWDFAKVWDENGTRPF